MKCDRCSNDNPEGSKFCSECGKRLATVREPTTVEERKQVTAFFSDLCGFTSLSERLDPEEIKEILTRIFAETTRIVEKYEGHIDKFIGDAVMVLFGVPVAHEDDPLRAVKSATEIHAFVQGLSHEYENRIGRNLAMHTGMNTGIVVAGELDIRKGTEKVLGDTINVAARLGGVAGENEIVIGKTTYFHIARFYDCEKLPPAKVKGKRERVEAYRINR